MFAYCLNNPVSYVDTNGLLSMLLTDMQAVLFDETTKETAQSNPSDSNPKNIPPDHPDYIPPKKGPRKAKNPNGNGWGWIDKEGNVWVWTPNMHGGQGWTVQEPGGGHSHAYPGGGVRTHCDATSHYEILEVFPSFSVMTQSTSVSSTTSVNFLGGCGAVLVVMIACGYLENPWGGEI